MVKSNNSEGNFNYNNIEKKNKNFMYKNLQKSYCYNCDFSASIFDFASFRGAHFKTCVFDRCSFKWAEFVGTNLKNCDFNNAVFDNTVFDSAKIEGVNFKEAKFNNTIFLSTDVEKAKNLNVKSPGIRIFNEMPQIEINDELHGALVNAMKNKYVKASRVLDTKDGGLNLLNIIILLDNFDTAALRRGLNIIQA
ncbi:MAG: pentapeptide repeat-containing protein, partial [Bacillota bacterium]|nr:pentapeptide repeat-containing protein [Bacillota bacterium]